MNRKIVNLFPQAINTFVPCTAMVFEASNGAALLVRLEDGTILPVVAHLSEVPFLREGDPVLVVRSEKGAIVQGRLRREGEFPRPLVQEDEQGRLHIEAAGGICLQVGESRIEILGDGRIRIDGEDVCTTASGRVQLRGGSIVLG